MTARAGKRTRWGGVEEVRAGVVEHGSPAGCGGWDAKAEEAEGGLSEDGAGHADCGLHDEWLHGVGKHVEGQKPEVGGAEGASGFDELAVAEGEDLRAHEASVVDPAGDGEGKDDVAKAAAEEGDKGDGEQDAGQGEEGVGDVDVEDEVGDAAVEAGDGADDAADEQ